MAGWETYDPFEATEGPPLWPWLLLIFSAIGILLITFALWFS